MSNLALLGCEEDPTSCEVFILVRAISNHDSSARLGKAVFKIGFDPRAMDRCTHANLGVSPECGWEEFMDAIISVAIVAVVL
jgi:hypothetical protein